MKLKAIKILTALILAGVSLSAGTSAFAVELGGVDIHGFVSQGLILSDQYNYLANDSKEGSFQYNELGINFGKDLTDKLRLGIQLFSRDVGDAGNNKITVDWAYGDYRIQDWLGLRAGRIKLPLGLYNETRDIDMLRTNIIMPQSLYPDLLRDTTIAANGAGAYGNIDLSGAGSLDYQAIAGQLNIDNESGFEKYFNNRGWGQFSATGDSDTDITVSGSLKWNTPIDGLLLGVSALHSTINTPISVTFLGNAPGENESENTFYTASAEYTWEDLVITAEYQRYTTDYCIDNPTMGRITQNEVTSEGYYLQVSYRFTDLFSMGAYYSVFYEDKDDRDGNGQQLRKSDGWEKDMTLSLRFDINEYCVFKVEGHRVDGTARVLQQDNPVQDEEDFYYGVAKVTFSF